MKFTAAEKAACARREAGYRRSCYVKWDKVSCVEALSPARKKELAMMEAIAADYDVLAAQEAGQAWALAPAQPVQAQLFGPACPRCTMRPDECLCDTGIRFRFVERRPGEEEPPF